MDGVEEETQRLRDVVLEKRRKKSVESEMKRDCEKKGGERRREEEKKSAKAPFSINIGNETSNQTQQTIREKQTDQVQTKAKSLPVPYPRTPHETRTKLCVKP